jgi:hypothetical protein
VAAISSIGTLLNVLATYGTPAAPAAAASANSPSGCTSRWYAIGATATGMAYDAPSSRASVRGVCTPRSTRGRTATRSSARRFAASVVSAPLPPST